MSQEQPAGDEEENQTLQYIILPYATNIASIYLSFTLTLSLITIALLVTINLMFFAVATYTLVVGKPPGN